MSTSTNTVLVEQHGHVLTLTINRPERRNSMTFETLAGLRDGFRRARAERDVRVVVLTGAGDRAFCAGADLGGIRGTGSDPEQAHEGRGQMAELFTEMYRCGVPTIARVRGYALAGGFGLAMACDFVVASDDSVFGTPEVAVGLWPYMITVPMLRSMPPKVALDLMITGRRVGADEALRTGFVNRVVPADRLDAAVTALADGIAAGSPAAIRLGRTAFYRALDMTTEQALQLLQSSLSVATTTGDAAEGVRAFAEKRSPEWRS
jgi:enoyl-CoA hydratase/carnithine racemase